MLQFRQLIHLRQNKLKMFNLIYKLDEDEYNPTSGTYNSMDGSKELC